MNRPRPMFGRPLLHLSVWRSLSDLVNITLKANDDNGAHDGPWRAFMTIYRYINIQVDGIEEDQPTIWIWSATNACGIDEALEHTTRGSSRMT